MLDLDVLILGAGPAGLAAGSACQEAGLNFRIIEDGPSVEERDHKHEAELGRGVGGAGLYSDGKFSFFPSATALWNLQPQEDLARSYEWLKHSIEVQGIIVPELEERKSASALTAVDSFFFKSYPSIYASLDQRMNFVKVLQSSLSGRLSLNTRVVSLIVKETGCHATVVRNRTGESGELVGKTAILATGRFGPLLIQQASNLPSEFRRLEIGVRIQQPSDKFFLSGRKEPDPKLLLEDRTQGFAWRTFCCCRDGEIVAIRQAGFIVLSGRSDVEPTGLSNVGFHVRLTDDTNATELWADLAARLASNVTPVQMPLDVFVASHAPELTPLGRLFGPTLSSALLKGLHQLTHEFGPTAFEEATLHGPTLEGLALYPKLGVDLKAESFPLWAAGDVTGIFRGLVAALVSGYFSGLQTVRALGEPI